MYGCSPDAGGVWPDVLSLPFNHPVFLLFFNRGKFKKEQRLFVI